MATSNNASGIGITDPNEFSRAATATATNFNPFDALGIAPGILTPAVLTSAYRRAHGHLHRAATAPAFPTAAEVNAARDHLAPLVGAPNRMAPVIATWSTAPRTFFAELALGTVGVFTAPSATAAPAAGATASAAPAGPSSNVSDPIIISSDEDSNNDADDDDDMPDAPAPPPQGPSHATPNRPRAAAPNPATPSTPSGSGGGSATATPTSNRSAGGSRRNTRVAHVNLDNNTITVGTWRLSPANANANAVVAVWDRLGRLNYRITAQDINGNAVMAPTATAVGFQNINFMAPYNGMSPNEVRNRLNHDLNQRRLQ